MRLIRGYLRPVLAMLALVGGAAQAEEALVVEDSARSLSPRNYGNFRVGGASTGQRPTLCLELSPLELLSVEACGTGSGFLHREPEPEIAHFRSWLQLASWRTEVGWIQPRVGLGFAELQVGEDSGGFHFDGVGPGGIETAGPEVGASLRLLLPVWAGTELVGELGMSLAYFHHAARLALPQSPLQPSASFSLGVGF